MKKLLVVVLAFALVAAAAATWDLVPAEAESRWWVRSMHD